MIKQGFLSDFETDMWMASLAFQTNPSLDMIIAVTVSSSFMWYPIFVYLLQRNVYIMTPGCMIGDVISNHTIEFAASAVRPWCTSQSYAIYFCHDLRLLSESFWMRGGRGDPRHCWCYWETHRCCLSFWQLARRRKYSVGPQGARQCWCSCQQCRGFDAMLSG